MKTAKNEKSNQEIHKELVDNLQELLQKNYDAEKGFTTAMKDAKNDHLKKYFKNQAAQRSQFTNELTNDIINLNETPKKSGSTTGSIHRTWIDIKSSLSGDNDEAVLEECIRGEMASLEEYEKRLKENSFPTKIEGTLTTQKNRIQNTLNKIRSLEDLAGNGLS